MPDATVKSSTPSLVRAALGAMDPEPGLVWAFVVQAQRCQDIDPGDLRQILADPALAGRSTWVWLHFNLADRRSPATLARHIELLRERGESGVPTHLLDAFVRLCTAPELHFSGGYLQGTLLDHVIDVDGVEAEQALVSIVVGPTLVLTGRRMHLRGVEAAHRRALAGELGSHPMRLLEMLALAGVDSHLPALQDLAHALDQIEDHVLTEYGAVERSGIIRIRRALVGMRRELAGPLRQFERVDQEVREETAQFATPTEGAGSEPWVDFGTILQRLQGLDDGCLSLLERARLLQQEASDQLTVQTNRQLYILSILTAVLMPPAIVVGVFGMNTAGLPLTKDPSGFWLALLMCAASSLFVLGILALSRVVASPTRLWRRESSPSPSHRVPGHSEKSGPSRQG